MTKVTLSAPIAWPFPHGIMRHYGDVIAVTDEERDFLVSKGAVADEPAQEAPEMPNSPVEDLAAAETPEVEKPVGKSYPPLPKKTAGVNVLREYARDHEIDIRGLSDKPEIMGHLMKVTGQ